ncbi:MAG TPA: EAL domain-containing protein [Gammaproteobacteria bacterium]|nr:EAL domain-containing protein [Gammaproteobacteria bacterium]
MPELFSILVLIASGFYIIYCGMRTKRLRQQLQTEIDKSHDLQKTTEKMEAEFSSQVLTDALTGLPGRKIFEDHLSLIISQSMRYQLTFSVMSLDLHGFKMINDTLGYDMGDAILRQVALRLKNCIRQVDTLSRFSGGEFVFIFSQINKAETAAYIAKRLLNALVEPFVADEQTFYLAASIGIAIFPMDGRDGKTLLKNADLALGQAKLQGRNTWQFYQQEMHTSSRRELILSGSLHDETSYRQFNILYQPYVNVDSRKLACMEAILEWRHPDFGLVTFEEFSQLAEKNNNIMAIYEWLLRNACQDEAKWRQRGFHAGMLSIRVSLKLLEHTHFIQKISSILHETGVDPSHLIFEITESSLLTKIDLVEKMLHMLKHLGVQIAINNFGAGHLPLQHLRRLPINIFKIDRSLVYDIDTNPESEAIVKMIIALATSLQSQVMAEGVMNASQKQVLLSLGCVTMQGPLFSGPVLAGDFNEKLLQTIGEGT